MGPYLSTLYRLLGDEGPPRPPGQIDRHILLREYPLIRKKQSKLAATKRAEIVRQYERIYGKDKEEK